MVRNTKVRVSHYDDRGDPYPPNNWRPEIEVCGEIFISFTDFLTAHNGCMPLKTAIKKAKKLAKSLKIRYEKCEVYGYDEDGNKEIDKNI